MSAHSTRTTKLDLRLSLEAKQTLTAAARAANRSVSQFILDSALSRAAETLPDRQRFDLNADQWEAFMAALDAPNPDTLRLQRLLQDPSVFDATGAE
jgi:uncharacterized protein (DUF1778 family)